MRFLYMNYYITRKKMADLIKIQLIGIYERLIDTIYIYIFLMMNSNSELFYQF